MRVYSPDRFVLPLPESHRFPHDKYRLLRLAVERQGLAPSGLLEPEAATDEDLLLVHDAGYLARVLTGSLSARELRRIGFPWSPELVERSRRSVGGTIGACRSALAYVFGVNLAGGTHHAFADRGEGFCVFNDAAIAARVVQRDDGVERVLIVDADVHQGNGSAAIFAADSSVFTFSIHCRSNFPYQKEQSDLDVELPEETGDLEYLERLAEGLELASRRFRADLAIYLAGVDPYEGDRWGRLNLSAQGLAARDRLVLDHLRAESIPVAVVMAGGYARDESRIAALHLQTVSLVAHRVTAPGLEESPAASASWCPADGSPEASG